MLGSLVAGSALARATGAYREAYLSWFNAAVGVWLIVAGLAIDHTGVARWNDLGVGATVFVVAIASIEAWPGCIRTGAGCRRRPDEPTSRGTDLSPVLQVPSGVARLPVKSP